MRLFLCSVLFLLAGVVQAFTFNVTVDITDAGVPVFHNAQSFYDLTNAELTQSNDLIRSSIIAAQGLSNTGAVRVTITRSAQRADGMFIAAFNSSQFADGLHYSDAFVVLGSLNSAQQTIINFNAH